jgi:hypothetical protein
VRAYSKKNLKKKIKNKYIERLNKEYETALVNLAKVTTVVLRFERAFPGQKLETSRQGGSFGIYMSRSNLDSFKCEELMELLGFFIDEKPEDTSSSEYPNYFNVDYKFTFDWGRVVINAYVKEESSTCHRVMIDEIVEEVRTPVYKMVCD